jgi:hypothetical protein
MFSATLRSGHCDHQKSTREKGENKKREKKGRKRREVLQNGVLHANPSPIRPGTRDYSMKNLNLFF